ncbi:MAG: carboxymuconolactone decarboxylase family protein [Deltaproteobacteria bacterium]|nr:MAG: carboxymuconolactone decarboxylase family protein [Deltaproteobacteria bacterium]
MKDLHPVFTKFKEEYPEIYEKHAALGAAVHAEGGPLEEKTRWLIKVAISGASGHERALQTHIAKAREAGVSEAELVHALMLMIPSLGFPAFMEAYSTMKGIS